MAWNNVDPQRFVSREVAFGQKPILDSTGSYTDLDGYPDLSGNTIVRRWRSSGVAGRGYLTLFTLLWDAFIVFFVAMTLHGPITINDTPYDSLIEGLQNDEGAWVFLLFPLIGLVLSYFVLAIWINRTVISIQQDMLVVTRGPIPWMPLKIDIKLSELRQLYVQAYSSYTENDRPVTSFRVMAQRLHGSDLVIDKGLNTYSDARILEQWLERKAGIQDCPVPGEAID